MQARSGIAKAAAIVVGAIFVGLLAWEARGLALGFLASFGVLSGVAVVVAIALAMTGGGGSQHG